MHGCEKKKSIAENTTNSYILQGINFVVSLFVFKISIFSKNGI